MYLTTLTLASLVVFLLADRSFVHFSRTARRLFWYLLSCSLGLSLVRTIQTIEGTYGTMWILLSAVLAASVVEDEVRKKIGLTTLEIDASRRLLASFHTPEAQGKAERLMDIVAAMNKGQGYTAGTKQLLLRMSGARQRLQRALHSVLESAESRELNYILAATNAPALLEVASKQTLDLLAGERLGDLTTVARAVVVDALQKLGLRYRPRRQRWACAVLLATHGWELTLLKAYLDDGGDYHTMYKLVYHDLQGSLQKQVVEHVAKEGKALVAETAVQRLVAQQHSCAPASAAAAAAGGPQQQQQQQPPGVVLKVLSDIDDTLFSSGGSFPAGTDTRYPRKTFYPGALALFAELDRCFARRHGAALRSAHAGVPPMTPRWVLSRSSPSKPPLASPEALGGDGDRYGGMGPFLDVPRAGSPQEDSTAPPSPIPTPFALLPQPSEPSGFPIPNRWSSEDEGGGGAGRAGGVSGGWSALGSPRTEQRMPPLILRARASRGEGGGSGGGRGPALQLHQEGSNLVFLSARPESYKGLTESEAYKKYFAPMVAKGQLDTAPTMLLGSLDAGPRAIAKYLCGWRPYESNPATAVSALYQTLAAKKLSRFRQYAAIYPEACFVFLGDNGQGDVLCAEILWKSMREGAAEGGGDQRLLACLMHKVVPLADTYSSLRSAKGSKAAWKDKWEQHGIFFSCTHVGMAVQALGLGLLDPDALHRVCTAACLDFRRICARYSGRRSGQNLGKAWRQLNKDLAAANATLPPHLQLPLLPTHLGGGAVAGEAGPGRLPQDDPRMRRGLLPARSDAAWSDISAATSTAVES